MVDYRKDSVYRPDLQPKGIFCKKYIKNLLLGVAKNAVIG